MNRKGREGLVIWPAIAVLCSLLSCAGPTVKPEGEEPVTLAEIVGFPRVRDLSFSPDSSRLAYVSDESGSWDLYTASISSGKQRRLTYSPAAAARPQWSSDGKVIAYLSYAGGEEAGDIYLILAEGGRPTRVAGGPSDETDIHWSPDGKKIAFASDREPRPDGKRGYAIWVVSVEDGELTRLTNADGDDREPRWSPKGDRIAFTSTRGGRPRESGIYVIPAEGGTAERLTSSKGAEAHPRWTANGGAILFHSDVTGHHRIGMARPGEGRIEWMTDGRVEQKDPEISSRGLLAYTTYDRGDTAVEFVSIAARREEPWRSPWDAGRSHDPTWAPNGDRLAFVHSGPASPGEAWVYRPSTEEWDQVVKGAGDLTEEGWAAVPSLVEWNVAGGGKIWGLLYEAAPERTGKGSGAVIWLHDGPRGRWENEYSPEIQALVAGGHTVLVPHFRGSTGSGVELEKANDRDWGAPELEDISGAADYLEENGLSGNGRVGLGGVGYGGFLALLAAANRPDRWGAVFSISGWVDLETAYRRGSSTFQRVIREEVGDPDRKEDEAWFEYLSPVKSAGAIRCPVLLMTGGGDPLVTPEDLDRMERALAASGEPTEVKVFRNDGRGLRLRRNRNHAMLLVRAFLREHLGR